MSSNYYTKAKRYNPETFEVEHTQFNYRTVDIHPVRLYVDEQTSTVVFDPFKWEKEVIGG